MDIAVNKAYVNSVSSLQWNKSVKTEQELASVTPTPGEARYVEETDECWVWVGQMWSERRAELVAALQDPNVDPTTWSEKDRSELDVLLYEQFNESCEIEIQFVDGKWVKFMGAP